jgi:hypothetical protein
MRERLIPPGDADLTDIRLDVFTPGRASRGIYHRTLSGRSIRCAAATDHEDLLPGTTLGRAGQADCRLAEAVSRRPRATPPGKTVGRDADKPDFWPRETGRSPIESSAHCGRRHRLRRSAREPRFHNA